MPKDAQVNVHLDKSQKERWDEFLEETHQVSSMSELVRSAVELYIQTDGGSESLGPTGDVDFGEVETELAGIQNRLSSMENSIQTVRREVESQAVDSSDLTTVLTAIPTQSELASADGVELPGHTPEEIADKAGLDIVTVKKALSQLEDDVPNIRSFGRSGETRRYRRAKKQRHSGDE